MQDALNFLLITGIVVNAILLILLFRKSYSGKWETPKLILIIFFSLTLALSVHFYAQNHEFTILYLLSFIPAELIEWLAGPLLYIYVKSVFQELKLSHNSTKAHFTPSLVILLALVLPILISIIVEGPIFPYLEPFLQYSAIYVIVRDSYLLLYLVLTYLLLQKLKESLSSFYSTSKHNELNWIQYLLIGTFGITVVDIITELLEATSFISEWDTGYLSVVLMIVLITYLGYHGINQSMVLLPEFMWRVKTPQTKISVEESKDYQEIQEQLKNNMITKRPFLNDSLTLSQLAQLMEISDKKLSLVLNQYMNTSFYEFVNQYRLNHFIELLRTDSLQTQTMFSLAQESGFKSKATFNRFFKKRYQITPTEYIAKNNL